jgi:hypothetical protein
LYLILASRLTIFNLLQRYSQLRPPSRNIKTSPALFTLERVMKSFRARSQLLVSRLEDGDEVLHLAFSDGEDNTQNVDSDGDEIRYVCSPTCLMQTSQGEMSNWLLKEFFYCVFQGCLLKFHT